MPQWLHGWTLALVIVVGIVWLLVTWLMVTLLLEEGRAWANRRRRQQQLTDEAMRYQAKRELQHHIRGLVDDERRRQLAAVTHERTPRG